MTSRAVATRGDVTVKVIKCGRRPLQRLSIVGSDAEAGGRWLGARTPEVNDGCVGGSVRGVPTLWFDDAAVENRRRRRGRRAHMLT